MRPGRMHKDQYRLGPDWPKSDQCIHRDANVATRTWCYSVSGTRGMSMTRQKLPPPWQKIKFGSTSMIVG